MLNIVIVGVGGQGTLLASRILGKLGMDKNRDVKLSEVHGMSQRGGSVITYVRIADEGESIQSALIEYGEADFVLAFEKLEAYRALPYLKKDGIIITSDQEIMPMPVITGAALYPFDALEKAGQHARLISVNALDMALECGSSKCANIVLIGVLAKFLNFDTEEIKSAVVACVPQKTVEMNMRAFEKGYAKEV